MSPLALLFVLISSFCAATASVILRLDGTGAFPTQVPASAVIFKLAALGSYGIGFLLYAWALRETEVRVAYPVMVSFTVIQLFIWSAMFESTPDLKALIGTAFILTGIFLTVR